MTAMTLRLAHIVLQTSRLDEMKNWYQAVLGTRTVFETPRAAFMTFDDEHHRLALVTLPELQERTSRTVGMAHSAYAFPGLQELLGRYRELRSAAIEPLVPIQHGVTTSLYYRDPDTNTVELQVDNFATADEATAYMQGPEYSADSAGPTFDPEAMAVALESGTPVGELTNRAWASQFPQIDVRAKLFE
jgi:catechol-2,3-dioxygenase